MSPIERRFWLLTMNEVFAPIAVLMPYRSVKEAVEIANGTRYGLGASVFGPDQGQCLKVAKQLDCGMVSINDFGVFYVSFLCVLFAVADMSNRSSLSIALSSALFIDH